MKDVSWLVDVGFAKAIWLLDNGQYVPVVNTGKMMPIKEDGEDWVGIELELESGYVERAYSELPIADAVEDRPTGWRPFSTACDLDSRDRYYGKLKVLTLEKYYLDDESAVKPANIAKNDPSKDYYIPMIDSAACAPSNMPFRNTAQSRLGVYFNTTCGAGLVGGAATIAVGANMWGSQISVEDANKKALAEIDALDTQAYANLNGPCNSVGVYNPGTIPAGRWWIRLGGITGISGFAANFVTGVRPGNMWFQTPDKQPDQTDVFLFDRFDRSYPVLTGGKYYEFVIYDGSGKTLRFWRDGLLVGSVAIASNYEIVSFPANPASGEKWWIDVV
jgi:hypothetical protein